MQRNATARYIERVDARELDIRRLVAAVREIQMEFSPHDVAAHRHAIEVMRNSLTHILDSTEGK